MNNKDKYDYIYGFYEKCKRTRQQFLDGKFQENYNAYHKTDNKTFEGKDWQSRKYIDIVKQKIVSGANNVTDMAFKNGIVPFQLEDPTNIQGLPEGDDYAMETLIKGQLLRGKAKPELEKMILSGSIYGEGYVKFYISDEDKLAYKQSGDNYIEFLEKIEDPMIEKISVWDIFRDMETDDIQNSAGIIERKYISPSDLEAYRSNPHVIENNLNKALEYDYTDETSQDDSPKNRDIPDRTNMIERLECWVRIPKGKKENVKNTMYCKAILAAGQIITYAPIEKFDIPYYRFLWEENEDGHGGWSVADNIGDLQSSLNNAFRTYEDNKHLSSRVMFAGISSYIKNMEEGFKTGGFLEVHDVDDIREAIQQFVVQDVGENLLSLINLVLTMSDMASNIPRTSQGQESSNPQTAYEIQQRLERAGIYIGRIMSQLDYVIEGVVERFYRWNMTDPEVPMNIKVPYDVKAIGFASYETRVIKTQKLLQTVQLMQQNPEMQQDYKLNPIYDELIKSNDIDPRTMHKTPEEKAQDKQNNEAERAKMEEAYRLDMEKQKVDIMKVSAEIKEILNEVNEKRIAGVREELGVDAKSKDSSKGQKS